MRKLGGICAALFTTAFLYGAALNAPAPKFRLPDTHHKMRALADYKGQVVFINFWASWCAPCHRELPEVSRLTADYRGKQVRVLAINVDKSRADAQALIAKLGLPDAALQVLWDTSSKIVSAYNIEGMPSSFVVDKQGIIRFIHVGFHAQDPAAWRREIDLLLQKKA